MNKRNCASCQVVAEDSIEDIADEIMETTTDDESAEDPYSQSEPDWDCENVSFRHYSWWQNRFQADQEEREGCPLTPQLRLVITEDPEHLQALNTHEAEKEPGHSGGE